MLTIKNLEKIKGRSLGGGWYLKEVAETSTEYIFYGMHPILAYRIVRLKRHPVIANRYCFVGDLSPDPPDAVYPIDALRPIDAVCFILRSEFEKMKK